MIASLDDFFGNAVTLTVFGKRYKTNPQSNTTSISFFGSYTFRNESIHHLAVIDKITCIIQLHVQHMSTYVSSELHSSRLSRSE
jgi:hypothetical protein